MTWNFDDSPFRNILYKKQRSIQFKSSTKRFRFDLQPFWNLRWLVYIFQASFIKFVFILKTCYKRVYDVVFILFTFVFWKYVYMLRVLCVYVACTVCICCVYCLYMLCVLCVYVVYIICVNIIVYIQLQRPRYKWW